jgi:ABC-type Na+ efflux pump permease subunit
MKRKIEIIFALIFGIIHFIIVGIPFILERGGGERLLYIMFIDLPLFFIGNLFFKNLLYNSLLFNFILFVIIGTLMYSIFGYFIGFIVSKIIQKNKSSEVPL